MNKKIKASELADGQFFRYCPGGFTARFNGGNRIEVAALGKDASGFDLNLGNKPIAVGNVYQLITSITTSSGCVYPVWVWLVQRKSEFEFVQE